MKKQMRKSKELKKIAFKVANKMPISKEEQNFWNRYAKEKTKEK